MVETRGNALFDDGFGGSGVVVVEEVVVLEEVVELEEDFVVWEIGKFATCEIEDFGRFWRSFCGCSGASGGSFGFRL